MAVTVERPPLNAGQPGISGISDQYETSTRWTTDSGALKVLDQDGSPLAEYPDGKWLRVYTSS